MEKFYVGGLFFRMPWREGIAGEVINAEGKRNSEAEGQRAIWNDIGIQIDGRKDKAHIAILDHPIMLIFPIAMAGGQRTGYWTFKTNSGRLEYSKR